MKKLRLNCYVHISPSKIDIYAHLTCVSRVYKNHFTYISYTLSTIEEMYVQICLKCISLTSYISHLLLFIIPKEVSLFLSLTVCIYSDILEYNTERNANLRLELCGHKFELVTSLHSMQNRNKISLPASQKILFFSFVVFFCLFMCDDQK